MAEAFRPDINPMLLTWARRSAHLNVSDLASACHVTEGEAEGWESGESKPTLDQLNHIATKTKRSLAVFFLADPPDDPETPKQFRTLGSRSVPMLSSTTMAAIRAAQESQERTAEILQEIDHSLLAELPALSIQDDVAASGERLRKLLSITLAQQHAWSGDSEAYQSWRAAIESLNVITLQASFPLEDGRAFCMFDRRAPVIVVNSWDCMSGRTFSLLHELVHLCLGLSALSPSRPLSSRANSHDREIEFFCNRLAAEVLLPTAVEVVRLALGRCLVEGRIAQAQVKQVAESYNVSRAVVVRSLSTLGMISTKEAFAFERGTTAPIRQKRGGPAMPQPKLCVTRKGVRLPSLVLDAYDQDRITMVDASRMLGLKVKWFDGLREQLGA